jgi:membrane-anchored protein YejM (alkaline phosphatase superfamily)
LTVVYGHDSDYDSVQVQVQVQVHVCDLRTGTVAT